MERARLDLCQFDAGCIENEVGAIVDHGDAIGEIPRVAGFAPDRPVAGLVDITPIADAREAVREIAHVFDCDRNRGLDGDVSGLVDEADATVFFECEEMGFGTGLLRPEFAHRRDRAGAG